MQEGAALWVPPFEMPRNTERDNSEAGRGNHGVSPALEKQTFSIRLIDRVSLASPGCQGRTCRQLRANAMPELTPRWDRIWR